ncbi:DUF4145 domain-containing protein [Sphingomonas aliaeris]|uniref:DUF4145 domain-containing protein n=1 Tax=Sphingomonas aliaeris TaxID=2759526 RepID=A0A974NW91_9SPHN|nr:DUF4145 domain-containing protein [Sphingomonas aliaeris]QQV78096.1 DUF4145 domain-containing protein [Sphingomonas aliaeris]
MAQHVLRSDKAINFVIAICGVCDFPSLYRCFDFKYSSLGVGKDLTKFETDFPGDRFAIADIWPSTGGDTPPDLPDNVAKFFEQGTNNERAEHWDAAGAMFRKALDVGTKIIDPSFSNKNLSQRINLLRESGRLTSDLAAWAHEVRIDGNESVHGNDPETREDVVAIHQFCRAVLLYTFSMPALVAARKNPDAKV